MAVFEVPLIANGLSLLKLSAEERERGNPVPGNDKRNSVYRDSKYMGMQRGESPRESSETRSSKRDRPGYTKLMNFCDGADF